MSLRKRGSVWFIDFRTPNGERICRSTETENKTQAKELHDKLKAETWRLQKLGERPKRYWWRAASRRSARCSIVWASLAACRDGWRTLPASIRRSWTCVWRIP